MKNKKYHGKHNKWYYTVGKSHGILKVCHIQKIEKYRAMLKMARLITLCVIQKFIIFNLTMTCFNYDEEIFCRL